MKTSAAPRPPRRSPWTLPILAGAGVLFALPTALALDGFWDMLSWALLAVPLGLVARAVARR